MRRFRRRRCRSAARLGLRSARLALCVFLSLPLSRLFLFATDERLIASPGLLSQLLLERFAALRLVALFSLALRHLALLHGLLEVRALALNLFLRLLKEVGEQAPHRIRRGGRGHDLFAGATLAQRLCDRICVQRAHLGGGLAFDAHRRVFCLVLRCVRHNFLSKRGVNILFRRSVAELSAECTDEP